MLSRTAENLYWLARYVERAEYLARTMEATLRVTALPNTYIGKTNEWDSALLTAGVSASFYEVYEEADERNVVEYLSFAPSNPSSIKNCIENARLNSRSVRTALTSEMWDTINGAWIDLQATWCAISTRSASPMAARALRSATPAASATGWSTAIWTISSSTACMNSSRNSSRITQVSAKSSPSSI